MANYLTRVELHHASREDYERLHEAMRGDDFGTTIRGDDGVLYQLPTAEYYRTTYLPINDVRARAAACAASVGRAYEVIVCESNSCAWTNLPRV